MAAQPAKPIRVYLVVTPDPTHVGTKATDGGRDCFWAKFGDGTFREAYDTHNPSNLGAENATFTQATGTVPNPKTGLMITKPLRQGKLLEYQWFKYTNQDQSTPTEWHRLTVKAHPQEANFTIETLRQRLLRCLQLFPQCNYAVTGNQPGSVLKQFEDVISTIVHDNCEVDDFS